MTPEQRKILNQALNKYYKAAAELEGIRDALFPMGATVISSNNMLYIGQVEVIKGSESPDKVRTSGGHYSIHLLKRAGDL